MKNNKNIMEIINKIGMPKILLLAVAGIVLMVFSFFDASNIEDASKKDNKTNISNIDNCDEYTEYSENYIKNMEKKIKEMIESLDGVEHVNVYVTAKNGVQKIVLTETPSKDSEVIEYQNDKVVKKDVSKENDYNTVYEEKASNIKSPFVVAVNNPQVKGVGITIKGNISLKIKENIVNLVNTLTGAGINNITIVIS